MQCFKFFTRQRIGFAQGFRRPFSVSHRCGMTFEGNKEDIVATPEERMSHYFGAGRLRGEPPESSSRRIRGDSRLIAGVQVPSKPVEPDNCCMSGCVNCVWALFNDDLKEWRQKRKEAAQKIKATEEVWPRDWNPPLAQLNLKNVPETLKTKKIQLDRQRENQKHKHVDTASLFPERKGPLPKAVQEAKKRHLQKKEEERSAAEEDEEGWQNVPVYIRAFAEFEKNKKRQKVLAQENNKT